MGINLHHASVLKKHARLQPFGTVLTIANLDFVLSAGSKRKLGIDISIDTTSKFLVEHCGAESVSSLDVSSYHGATIVHDLNNPLTEDVAQFDTVIDGGTVEHIFNVVECLRSITNLTAVGGRVFINCPINNYCGHGFYQLSPELFFELFSKSNGFVMLEALCFKTGLKAEWDIYPPRMVKDRVELTNVGFTEGIFAAVKIKEVDWQPTMSQWDYRAQWDGQNPHCKKPGINRFVQSVFPMACECYRKAWNAFHFLKRNSFWNKRAYKKRVRP